MRSQLIASLMFLAVLAGPGVTWSQEIFPAGPSGTGAFPPMTSGSYGPAYEGSFPGAMTMGAPSASAAGHSAVMPGGYPPTMNAWPNISPYENSYSQHIIDDGTWMHNHNNRQREYFFGVDYLNVETKRPSGVVGSKRAQSYYEQIFDELEDVTDLAFTLELQNFNYFNSVNARAINNPESDGMEFRAGFTNPDDSGVTFEVMWTGEGTGIYDARRQATRNFQDFDNQGSNGNGLAIFPQTGTNPGNTSNFTVGGATNTQRKLIRNERQIVENLILQPPYTGIAGLGSSDIGNLDADLILQRQLLNLRGLPLNNGSFNGVTVPYDLEFILEERSEVFGTNVNFVTTPLVKKKYLNIQPVFGARYMHVGRDFRFLGVDSGLLYDESTTITAAGREDVKLVSPLNGVDDDGNGIIDDAGIIEGETTVAGFRSIRSSDDVSSIIRAVIDNDTVSHLAGPQSGLNYAIGSGKSFRLLGSSQFGLMVNREEMQLRGDNIGFGTRIDPATYGTPADGTGTATLTGLVEPTAANPNPNAFRESRTTTHISPMFEQALTAEIPIFEHVPFLRRQRLLEGAKFRIGWNMTYLREIVSPNNSIVYQGNPTGELDNNTNNGADIGDIAPIFPKLKVSRQDWWINSYNIGVEWRY